MDTIFKSFKSGARPSLNDNVMFSFVALFISFPLRILLSSKLCYYWIIIEVTRCNYRIASVAWLLTHLPNLPFIKWLGRYCAKISVEDSITLCRNKNLWRELGPYLVHNTWGLAGSTKQHQNNFKNTNHQTINLPDSQLSPSYPDGHWHSNPSGKSTQVAPFWHGSGMQKLISISQLSPA